MIIAYKDGRSKRFSQVAWDLMGKSKNGWSEVKQETSNAVIDKTITSIPPTGQKETLTEQVVENVVEPVLEETKIIENTVIDENASMGNFTAIAKEHLSKNKIKDFFDAENITYKSSDNTDTLIALLVKHLNGDIELLKSKFSI